MSICVAADSANPSERIAELLVSFKLSTAACQMSQRLAAAGLDAALTVAW